jgi:hypothetical protein
MPGMSISGVHRLQVQLTVLLAGLIALLAAPTPSWAASAPGTGAARAQFSGSPAVTGRRASSAGGQLASAPASVVTRRAAGFGDEHSVTGSPSPSSLVWAGSAAAVDDVVVVEVAERQPVASTDRSADLVSAQPAVVPWILVALFILVVVGAVRAYGKSPQRAALRSRRTPR